MKTQLDNTMQNKGQSFPDTTEHKTTLFLTIQYHTSQDHSFHVL